MAFLMPAMVERNISGESFIKSAKYVNSQKQEMKEASKSDLISVFRSGNIDLHKIFGIPVGKKPLQYLRLCSNCVIIWGFFLL
jgi:hypothetical protein